MAYKPPTGSRPPMSEEARLKISESIRLKAAERRADAGLPPIAYGGSPGSAAPDFLEKPIEKVKMNDQEFSADLFVPMKTGKPIDKLFTLAGGVPKACNYLLIGDPGVGKSTVSLDIISDLQAAGYKVLFISAEMNRIDLYEYVQRFPKFGDVDIIFTGEYCDSNPKTVIEGALTEGYDIVLIDSFAEVQDDVRGVLKYSAAEAEKWLINLMISHNIGNNEERKHTTFIAIQQVTKNGIFIGSNKIKHATQGMLELRMDQSGQSYMSFSKNRRGSAGKRMYYSLAKSGDVFYDEKRYNNDENVRDAVEREKEELNGEESNFDALLGISDDSLITHDTHIEFDEETTELELATVDNENLDEDEGR
jgi:ABC-type dipeptide/oligopeptide/nickel transport system ATPase subunit